MPRNVETFPQLNIKHSTFLTEGLACFIWLLEEPLQTITTMRQTEFRLQHHESKTEIQRMPAVTCLARTVEVINRELPGETSFQLKGLLDISSYLSHEA